MIDHATEGMDHPDRGCGGFVGTMPAFYDAYQGPFFFEPFAADLAARLRMQNGDRLLETCCGTGISTRHLRRAVPGGVEIVATDVSESMLAFARARNGRLENVVFELVDAAALPYGNGSFAGVASQFGLMFVPDKGAALREAHRVLRPEGRILFNVWDERRSNPFVQVVEDAVAAFFPAEPPAFYRLPWSCADRGALRGLMTEAGFSDVSLETVRQVGELPSARHLAEGMIRGNATILAVEERASAPADEIVAAAAHALGEEFGHAPLRAPLQAVVVSAARPGD